LQKHLDVTLIADEAAFVKGEGEESNRSSRKIATVGCSEQFCVD